MPSYQSSYLWACQSYKHLGALCCPSIHQTDLAFLCCLNGCIGGRYSDLFPSILSSSSSRLSNVKFLKLWIINFLSRVANLAFMSSSSLVNGVSEPRSELWNDPNSRISLPCLLYQGSDLELISVIQLQFEGRP